MMMAMQENKSGKMRAFALPAVMVISVLVMTMIAMCFSLVALDSKAYQEYRLEKQRMLDLESALVLYMHDSLLCRSPDSSAVNLYKSDERTVIFRRPWGLYEYASASDRYGNAIGGLYGRKNDSGHEAAFWICDRNRALTLDTGAVIDGPVYIPPNGINYSGRDTGFHHIPPFLTMVSSEAMPPLENDFRERTRQVFSTFGTDTGKYTGARIHNGFMSVPLVIMASPDDSVFSLSGMVVLHGDEVTISGKSAMHDVIICARKVTVRSGFRGCIQIFCRDSVTIESGAALEWPSGICVESASGFPHVELCGNSRVSGYVAVIGAKPDMEMNFPGYEQHGDAVLEGLLYADCSCGIEGRITGAAYVRDCFHIKDSIKYPGTIGTARISREEKLAFPILMKGRYERKPIKRLL